MGMSTHAHKTRQGESARVGVGRGIEGIEDERVGRRRKEKEKEAKATEVPNARLLFPLLCFASPLVLGWVS